MLGSEQYQLNDSKGFEIDDRFKQESIVGFNKSAKKENSLGPETTYVQSPPGCFGF